MRKISTLTFITLDGVMQSPGIPEEDTSGGFETGGWAADYWQEVMEQVVVEAMREPYDLLLGHNTYKQFSKHWFQAADDNPIADRLNTGHKYVVTNQSSCDLSWGPATQINDPVIERIHEIKQGTGPLLQIHGSWKLIQSLLTENLIDEFRLWVFPVTVGSGKRLFDGLVSPRKLKLVQSKTTSHGVVMAIYQGD